MTRTNVENLADIVDLRNGVRGALTWRIELILLASMQSLLMAYGGALAVMIVLVLIVAIAVGISVLLRAVRRFLGRHSGTGIG
jgi:hypothetical protein